MLLQGKEDTDNNRMDSIQIVKSFNVIKTLVWSCTQLEDEKGEEVEKEEQFVNLDLLLDIMKEVKLLLELIDNGSTYGINEKSVLRRLSLVRSNQVG